jgi:hypothetical protein
MRNPRRGFGGVCRCAGAWLSHVSRSCLKPVPQPGRSWRFDKSNCANPALLSDQQSEQCDQRKTYENYRPIPDIKTKKPTLNPRMCEHVAPPHIVQQVDRQRSRQTGPGLLRARNGQRKENSCETGAHQYFVPYQLIGGIGPANASPARQDIPKCCICASGRMHSGDSPKHPPDRRPTRKQPAGLRTLWLWREN